MTPDVTGEFVTLADEVANLRRQAGDHEREADRTRRLATLHHEMAGAYDLLTDIHEAKSLEDTLRARLIETRAGDAIEDETWA